MKKFLFGLCALMMCGMAVSCSDSKKDNKEESNKEKAVKAPLDQLKDITADIEKNGASYDADKWVSVMKEYSDVALAFYGSNPTKEQYDNFEKAVMNCESALRSVARTEDGMKNIQSAMLILENDDSFKDVQKRISEAERAARKNFEADIPEEITEEAY